MYAVARREYRYSTRDNIRELNAKTRITRVENSRLEKERNKERIKKYMRTVCIVIAAFIFLICIGSIASKAKISSMQREVNEINYKIMEIKNENSRLESRIVSSTNIEKVRENASRLGMAQPTADQIVYISVDDADDLNGVTLHNSSTIP